MAEFMDITGKRFGRLTAVNFIEYRYGKQGYWLFLCNCGNKRVIKKGSVLAGKTKSCGCLRRESILKIRQQYLNKHGFKGTRFYGIWTGMKGRCRDKGNRYYGARGITVCVLWTTFGNFKKEMYNFRSNQI